MKTKILSFIMLLIVQLALAQMNPFTENLVSVNELIDGTLTLPEKIENPSLVILIQGSGPTDRDGNQMMMKNDASKKIAHQLAENGIASYRFDKRIFKMNKFKIKEADLRFEYFVTDVNAILEYFKADKNFDKIILAGHSEGSLIGMIAAQHGADAFISLAGAGRSIDKIIVEQLAKQSEELSENARQALDEIIETGSTVNYSPYLESIFRPSVQPYINSWMKYDPALEIAKLEIPILIINGSFDLQVDTTDAEILNAAAQNSKLVILENMNHIFREIKGENLENTKAYNEPNRPLHPELIPVLTDFIKSIK
ncbi:MAG: alpha/beta hydrolase [Flavobacteriaceae bacterium]|nr:alpha/beta hydrolase [Flavobacteriaceae bacterium]